MYLPNLEEFSRSESVQVDFKGYNHTDAVEDTQFYDMKNMTASAYPVLTPRAPRQLYTGASTGTGGAAVPFGTLSGLFSKEKLCWVEDDVFYYNGGCHDTDGETMSLSALPAGKRRQFVSMGAYVLIFPDKKYYNTETQVFGSLEASFTTTNDVHFTLAARTGDPLLNYTSGSTPPVSPQDGDLWLDTSAGTPVMKQYNASSGAWEVTEETYAAYTVAGIAPEEPKNGDYWMDTSVKPHVLKQFSSSSGMWASVPTVYVKIASSGLGKNFEQYDGVTISGCEDESFNGDFIVFDRGEDYLLVTAVLDMAFTQDSALTVKRRVPDMDFVCELNNRVWGCSSEQHEIYASALGNPKNWNCFMGTSQDSYAVTVGSDGDFTGCIAHLGYVLFFKEDIIHKMYGTKPENFQLSTTHARGVERGSEQSLAIVNETLYYKSRDGVCGYDGSLPYEVGVPLGPVAYRNACAGALGRRYYLSMQDPDGQWHLFVYDTGYQLWHKEDNTQAAYFTRLGPGLYFLDVAAGRICGVDGEPGVAGLTGAPEGAVAWFAEGGELWQSEMDRKYLTRLQLRFETEAGASIKVEASYGRGAWQTLFETTGAERRTWLLPVLPARSDSIRLRFSGVGPCRIFGATRQVEVGSEV